MPMEFWLAMFEVGVILVGAVDGRGRTENGEKGYTVVISIVLQHFLGFLLYGFDANRPANRPASPLVPFSSLRGLCKYFNDSLQVVRDRLNYPSCRFPYHHFFLFGNDPKFLSRSSHNVAESSPSANGSQNFMSWFVETKIVGNTITHPSSVAQNIHLNILSSTVRRIQSQFQIGALRLVGSERATGEEISPAKEIHSGSNDEPHGALSRQNAWYCSIHPLHLPP